ncbi:hypothetical protein [Lyngbya confervoides]|uniref:Baseplate protein J-like domain-containing protein n=1 Tax=Lyngbya confervoides BDU141951 TaxID=1574623 RepID=A0ABD4T0U0_9CYAN|nr:hypothetical protein [Lyngbya confervoides]MCM1982220.1 hypothetical protein [Lyngbya confervoides BDU141951]
MTQQSDALTPAQDQFERYYTEKLWDWIPAIYRDEDGLADYPGVLRALVTLLAQQAAIARRSLDRLWEDQFIELCDDWAIPYLGDLVGTRLVHELNRRGRRVDVARTIFYRRRKGTPLVLERLTQDITGWEGTVVESFRRLGRTRHGLDPELADLQPIEAIASLYTPPGGWANLKSAAPTVDGPFEGLAHTPDFRQLRGHLGRYNIPKLNVHLYRLRAYAVELATPFEFGSGRWTVDPSGRDIPLFRPDQRLGGEEWQLPQEWQFPAPIPCRLLGDARYQISFDQLEALEIPADSPLDAPALSPLVGIPFRQEARLRRTLQSLIPNFAALTPAELAAFETLLDQILAVAIAPSSPKAYLVPSSIQVDPTAIAVAEGLDQDPGNASLDRVPLPHQRLVAGTLSDWGVSLSGLLPPTKRLVIDPERGRLWFPPVLGEVDPVWVLRYHYGLAGNLGAGTYDRQAAIAQPNLTATPPCPLISIPPGDLNNPGPIPWALPPERVGIFQFENSKTYTFSEDLIGVERLVIQVENPQRPYLRRLESEPAIWQIEAAPKPDPPDPELDRRTLILEGLWIGLESPEAVPGPPPRSPVMATLELAGNFDRVEIRHCTLDPGGEQAVVEGVTRAIPAVQLLVRGTVEDLVIESSIVGPIAEASDLETPGTIAQITIRDSIVQSLGPAPAIETHRGTVTLDRCTVFGEVQVKVLQASDSLIQGRVAVVDNQHGCFRFSATRSGADVRLPPQFESHLFTPEMPSLYFVSRRFGDPGYGQLSDRAPLSIVRGAENRAEMGAFNHLFNPIKLDDLRAKMSEFMPFGLIAQFIHQT